MSQSQARKPLDVVPGGPADTVHIRCASGEVFTIDAADWHLVEGHSWNIKRIPGNLSVYVQRTVRMTVDGAPTKRGVSLHRLIANAQPGDVVDHKDGDTLNNRRSNLRLCTQEQNARNVRSKNMREGKLKGVHWNVRAKKWEAKIGAGPRKPDGRSRSIYLGIYATPEEAGAAYDAAAIKHFGEFSATNFPVASDARTHEVSP